MINTKGFTGIALLAFAGMVYANTYQVDSVTDAADITPGDGVCASAANECTLRAAIQEATATTGSHTINLPAATYSLTITEAGGGVAETGPLDLSGANSSSISVTGAGRNTTIIDGTSLGGHIFHVSFGTHSISNLTIRNSSESGINIWGGDLSVSNITLASNSGSAIYSVGSGNLTVTDTLFLENTFATYGSALRIGNGTADISNSIFDGNTAGAGGGGTIYVSISGSSLGDVNFDNIEMINPATNGNYISSQSPVTITKSLLLGNGSNVCAYIASPAGAIISNSTLTSCYYGLIAFQPTTPPTSIVNSTITQNTFGWEIDDGVSVHVANSIIAGNSSDDCRGPLINTATVTSNGANIFGDASCDNWLTAGDQSGTDPLLEPLADNGGATRTFALQAGSPAIDAADNADCPATDQRGISRPQDGDENGIDTCDIGAFEVAVTTPDPGGSSSTTTSAGGAGGGGCAIGSNSRFDPLLPALVFAALLYLLLRRRYNL